VDLTLQGTYTNWASDPAAAPGTAWRPGESLVLAVDFGMPGDPGGVIDATQLGFAVAMPVHPGAGLGSGLASLVVSGSPIHAFRFDAGFESLGTSRDNSEHVFGYFIGLGMRVRVPITRTVAFVMGRTGAAQFGQFTNLDQGGSGFYWGSAFFPMGASDFLVISGGGGDSAPLQTQSEVRRNVIGVNLPAGLLVQPDPHFALTLQSGYSAVISLISVLGAANQAALHFIPLVLEAVATPTPAVDIGTRLSLDGFVGVSGDANFTAGYFDRRALIFWFRFHIG